MNKYERTLKDLLHQAGFTLRRDRRHRVFGRDDGLTFVTSKTPGTQSASREQVADLNRLLRRPQPISSEPSVLARVPQDPVEQPKKRLPLPNNPPRTMAEVRIPKLDAVSDTSDREPMRPPVRIGSIVEVLTAADKSNEFWKLDACGRIRTLVNVAKRSSNLKVDILPALFIKASVEEICWRFGHGEIQKEDPDIPEAMIRREGPLYVRTLKEWGFKGVPSLLVQDPLIGNALIEASAWSVLENTDYLFLRYGDELEGTSYGIASHVWDAQDPTKGPAEGGAPDHFIYSTFITTSMMKRKGFTIQTCVAWVDPKITRLAVRQILEIMRDERTSYIEGNDLSSMKDEDKDATELRSSSQS